MGLVKIDLLGNRSLSVIEEAMRQVERERGAELDILEDTDRLESEPATARLIREGLTMGCFYIESPAMRQLLVKLQVASYEDLTAASSVIRPGVAESGMMQQYIERHRGEQPVEYLHPKMEAMLGETRGVMVYQEDVIRVAHEIAGMSLGEADLLRRAMSGKGRSKEAMEKLRQKFIAMSVERDIRPEVAAEIWRQIASFAGYSFCKAHSAAYARVSYQAAYLKAHYPAEMMAAVLANHGGFYGPSAYIEEARRLGIEIMPPDVNKSGMEYSGAGRTVRIGLDVIANVTRKTLEEMVSEREANGYYTCLRDFCARVSASYLETQILIRCGVFDSFELTRPELLWRLAFLYNKGKKTAGGNSCQGLLPLGNSGCGADRTVVPRLPEYSRAERLALEYEHFGFTASEHPLSLLGRKQIAPGLITAIQIPECRGRRVRLIGRSISRKRIMTDRGAMMFLSLDDLTAPFEVVIFADCYKRYAAVATGPGPFLVTGKVHDEHGVCTLVCEKLQRLENANGKPDHGITSPLIAAAADLP
jgi:DNA polymerase III alpha subunit